MWAGLAACLLAGAVVAQETPSGAGEPPQADRLYREGREARDGGRFDEAIDRLSRAAALEPGNADTQVQLGLALAAKRRYGEARTALQAVLDRAPGYHDARLGLARIAFWTDDLDAAERELRALLARAPDYAEAAALERQIATARTARDALSAKPLSANAPSPKSPSPKSPSAKTSLPTQGQAEPARQRAEAETKRRRLDEARAWRLRGSFAEAERIYRTALRSEPRNADVLVELGLTLAFQGRHAEARDAFAKALAADPASSDARLGLARVDLSVGDLDAADARLGEVLAARPDNLEAQSLHARVRLARGEAGAAEAAFRQIAGRDSQNPDTFVALGDSLRGLLRDDEAHEAYGRAAALAPESADAKSRLAAPIRPRWRFDLDGGFSRLSGGLEDWQEGSLRVGYQLSERTTLSGGVEVARRFGTTDTLLGARVDQRWSDLGSSYVGIGGTPDAHFRPQVLAETGGAVRVRPASDGVGPTFATLDLRFARYGTGDVTTISPGVQQFVLNGRVWFSAKLIETISEKGELINGYLARTDVAVTDRLHAFGGYSDAPDTSDGRTVPTRSLFGGLGFDLDDRTTLRVSVSREDRRRSYDRSTISVGLSARL